MENVLPQEREKFSAIATPEEEEKVGGFSLQFWIALSVLFGGVLGFLWAEFYTGSVHVTTSLALPGKLWLKALKCIVLPMIVLSMIDAMVMMRSLPGSRSVGLWCIGLYSITTLMAATEGCVASALILSHVTKINTTAYEGDAPDLPERTAFDTILGVFDNLIPSNLVGDAGRGNLMPIIVASIIFGMIVPEKGEDGSKSQALRLIGELSGVVKTVVTAIMSITPLGVGSLVFASASTMDLEDTGANLLLLTLATLAGLAVHVVIVYPTILVLLAHRNPVPYYRNIVPAWLTMLGTASSAATLPQSLACAATNEIPPHTANFVLSLGATVNMDGSCLYFICATYFLGAVQGVSFNIGDFISMALLATFCSMGSAPIPSSGLVLIVTIMASVGVPFNETFGIISAVDWFLDRCRGIANIAGDATIAAVIDHQFAERKDLDGLEMPHALVDA